MVIHIAFRGGGIGKQPVDPFGIALRAHYFEMLVRRDKADLFPGVALCHYVGIVAYLAKLFADGGDLFVGIFLVHADFDNIEVIDIVEEGNRLIQFHYEGIFEEILDQLGEMPLPPYITHKLKDKNRYQTVYAKNEGSAAAPTAGLHFTKELLEQVKEKGVNIAHVTLHVGLGTFRPVKVDDVEQHHMHSEFYIVEEDQAKLINDTKKNGGRVIAVGTTSCRTLESATGEDGILKVGSGWTEIFIYPGYKFKMIDGLITNFHLPESTLVMLVSALAGKENIMHAYEVAVQEKYRFFSFGDAMIIL